MLSRLSFLIVGGALFSGSLGADDSGKSTQLDEIISELRRIRALLESTRRLQPSLDGAKVTVDVRDAPVLGSMAAPVSIVEFMDYECPFCRQFYSQTLPELRRRYVETGKVRFYVMAFPLDKHKTAMLAARAARCAHQQLRFWSLHDAMETDDVGLELNRLTELAGRAGADADKFRSCVDSADSKEAIRWDMNEAARIGVGGTPAFIIGRTINSGVEGEVVLGNRPFGVFAEKIDSLIGGAEAR